MSYEVTLVKADQATRELKELAFVKQCATHEEAEDLARDLNRHTLLPIDEFFTPIEREDEEDEDE